MRGGELGVERETPGAPLSDGRHFGYIRSLDASSSPATVSFDRAAFLTGEAATEAARADGAIAEDEPV